MIRIGYLALALSVAAAARPLAAQQPEARPGMHGAHGARGMAWGATRMDHFAHLLEMRQQLALTDAQVTRIEAIRTRLQAQNEPLLAQLRAAHAQAGMPVRDSASRGRERPRLTEEQRSAMRQMRERMRPVMQQVGDNTRTAMREVHGLLTEQQRGQIQQMRREHRGMRGRPGHAPRGGRMRSRV